MGDTVWVVAQSLDLPTSSPHFRDDHEGSD